ncbi:MAG: ACP S-malonyltransferase [archaeon]
MTLPNTYTPAAADSLLTDLYGLFPGQGNQYVGMGKDLYETYPLAKRMYDLASDITGHDLTAISFSGPESVQKETLNTQLITFVHSCVVHALITEQGNPFSGFAGHSIGEYAALVAVNSIAYATGVMLVLKRAELMNKISFEKPSLVAILGATLAELEEFCDKTNGALTVALHNAPKKYVIGGLPEAIQEYLPSMPGKKIPLGVSGPFHTKHYQPIAEEFMTFMKHVAFKEPVLPVYANATAQPHTQSNIAETLAEQLYRPVLWEETMRNMQGDFLEMGPGNSLSKFAKDVHGEVLMLNAHDQATVEKAKQYVF